MAGYCDCQRYNVDTLAPRLQVPSSLSQVHLQLLVSPWQTLPTGKLPDHAATSIHRINSSSLHSEVCVLVEAAETAQKQHQLLGDALSGLRRWQSNERLSRLPKTAARFASRAAAADKRGYMHGRLQMAPLIFQCTPCTMLSGREVLAPSQSLNSPCVHSQPLWPCVPV